MSALTWQSRLSGDDLDGPKKYGDQIAASVGKVRGGEDVKVEQITGLPQLKSNLTAQQLLVTGSSQKT